jgi:hypothetical protein
VVVEGETVFVAPAPKPLSQLYVEAPEALRVLDAPMQIVADEASAVTVGRGLTVTVVEAVFTQPLTSVPVTV